MFVSDTTISAGNTSRSLVSALFDGLGLVSHPAIPNTGIKHSEEQ